MDFWIHLLIFLLKWHFYKNIERQFFHTEFGKFLDQWEADISSYALRSHFDVYCYPMFAWWQSESGKIQPASWMSLTCAIKCYVYTMGSHWELNLCTDFKVISLLAVASITFHFEWSLSRYVLSFLAAKQRASFPVLSLSLSLSHTLFYCALHNLVIPTTQPPCFCAVLLWIFTITTVF